MIKWRYVFFGICLGVTSCNECEFKNRWYLKEYSGIVIEKNFYEWDHGAKNLIIKNGGLEKKYHFPSDYIYHDIWDQIQVGDSISKPENIFDLSIYRNGTLIASKPVKINCN